MKKTAICKNCSIHKDGSGCLYVLADKSELCPNVKKGFENFRTDFSKEKAEKIRKDGEKITREIGDRFDDVAKTYEELYIGEE
jgi:hypothetical protein